MRLCRMQKESERALQTALAMKATVAEGSQGTHKKGPDVLEIKFTRVAVWACWFGMTQVESAIKTKTEKRLDTHER